MNNSKENIKFNIFDLIKSIIFLLGKNKSKYIFWNLALILSLLYAIVPPLILGKVVDFFTNFHSNESLTPFYFYVILLGSSYALVSYIRLTTKKHLGYISTDAIYNIRVKGFEKLLALSLIEHKDENTGAKSQKIENGTNALSSINLMLNNQIYPALSSTVGMFLVFIFLRPEFIIFLILYIIVASIIIIKFNKKLQTLNYEKNIATESASGSYIEGLGNILTIKSTGAEAAFKNKISSREELTKNFRYQITETGITMWQAQQILNGFSMGAFLFLVGHGVMQGTITVGSIIIFYSYLQQLIGSAGGILDVYSSFIDAKTMFARMMPIFKNKVKKYSGDKDFPADWQLLEIAHGNFDYKEEEQKEYQTGVYDIDLKINQFEKIGFAGKTGSGKSTLAKLLIGLYPFNSGGYRINSTNFYDIKNEEILKNISLVLQESEMFNLTLKDNITLMYEFDLVLFEKAINISQLGEVIKKLPQGIETLIGEKGYYLSGGERQRVGIARAIYRNCQIIIFDEATSSLDSRTEKLIHESLEQEIENKTIIFIAHRVSTLKNVDKIYVFDKGRIVESGKYEELYNNPDSLFLKLNKP
jgi:ABC-type multidrug transport system fused ATPase/permease subunit